MDELEYEEYLRNEMSDAENLEERNERIAGGKEEIFNYYYCVAKGISYEEQKKYEDDFRDELEEAGESQNDIDAIIEEWYEVTPTEDEIIRE